MSTITRKISVFVFFLLIFWAVPSYAQATQAVEGDMVQRTALFIFQISVIIFAARLGGGFFERLKLPSVLGEILTGTLIGPYVLGAIPLPGFPTGLFPLGLNFPVSAELYSLTTLASILLLFLVGLETDIDTFIRYSVAGTVVGIGGVIVSFVFGDLCVVLLSKYIFGHAYGFFHPVSIMMGVISTATSVGITARILSERKKMDSPEGITVLSAAVIDDVLGIIILAVTLSVIKSGTVAWTKILGLSVKALVIWLGFTLVGILYGTSISELLKRNKDHSVIATISFALALFLAGLFEKSGLAMIVGAYVMGLALSKTDISLLIRENLTGLYRFLVPLFFCVMGMLVNVKDMFSYPVALFSAGYIVFCVLGKIIGCSLPAMFLNFNPLGMMRIGVGMIPRGEVALIIAGICLSFGILPHDYFSVAIAMTFITTLIAPPLLSVLFHNENSGIRREKHIKSEHKEIPFNMPNTETGEFFVHKILTTFEGEGFFIHQYDISEKVYQMRKDQTFITMRYTPQEIRFSCNQKDSTFVHTLFYEVLADAERVMLSLEKLADKKSVGRKIFAKEPLPKKEAMSFSHIICPTAVQKNLKGQTKRVILEELIALLIKAGKLQYEKRDEVMHDLSEREDLMSTGMQEGVAFPHAKTAAIDHLVCALGIKHEGIDFDSLDKKPSTIFVLVVSPRNAPSPYLQFMAELSKVLREEKNRERLLRCTTDEDLYETFCDLLNHTR